VGRIEHGCGDGGEPARSPLGRPSYGPAVCAESLRMMYERACRLCGEPARPRDRADMIKNAPLTFSAFEQRPWPIFRRPQPASPWRSFRQGLGCRVSNNASLGLVLDRDPSQERASLQAMRAKPWRLLSAVGGLVPSLSRCPEAPRCLPRKRFVTFRPWP